MGTKAVASQMGSSQAEKTYFPGEETMAKKQKPVRRGKRPYVTPKLTVHGNLREVTLAKGYDKNDGGAKPNTRNPAGGPA